MKTYTSHKLRIKTQASCKDQRCLHQPKAVVAPSKNAHSLLDDYFIICPIRYKLLITSESERRKVPGQNYIHRTKMNSVINPMLLI